MTIRIERRDGVLTVVHSARSISGDTDRGKRHASDLWLASNVR
jgi:hypothetical protein